MCRKRALAAMGVVWWRDVTHRTEARWLTEQEFIDRLGGNMSVRQAYRRVMKQLDGTGKRGEQRVAWLGMARERMRVEVGNNVGDGRAPRHRWRGGVTEGDKVVAADQLYRFLSLFIDVGEISRTANLQTSYRIGEVGYLK